jgi:3',5'-nucleoside bisphosphate phosphatase
LRTFRADLHVHTVLSPCAGVEMIPPLIVQAAQDKKIDIIAICDHNATANVSSVQKAAEGTGLSVIPGMELQTREEVHCICLFNDLKQAEKFQLVVDSCLPDIGNDPDLFGEQFIVDETGDFIAHEKRMLSTSTSLTLEKAWKTVEQIGGILIPAHIDRIAFGLISQLGFIPQDIPFRILEISRYITTKMAYEKYPQTKGFALFQDGDVHFLDDFLGGMLFTVETPALKEILLAVSNEGSRHFEIQN